MAHAARERVADSEPAPGPTAGALLAAGHALAPWRLVLDKRALPLPTLRPLTIGSDARSGLQLAHGSVRPLHARLERRGGALWVSELNGKGDLRVDGAVVSQAQLHGGETLTVGQIPLRVERGEVTAAVKIELRPPPSFEEELRRVLVRELKRVPWLAVSVGFHSLLFLALRSYFDGRPPERDVFELRAAVSDAASAMPAPAEPKPSESPPEAIEEPVELPEPAFDDLDTPQLPDAAEDAAETALDATQLRALGFGAGSSGGAAAGGFGGRGISLKGAPAALSGRLDDLRVRGLDLVFVIDTTASMGPFLDAAKVAVSRIITDLAALVPAARLGVIAYRDQGDEYVTKTMPISNDRYAILNFVSALEAKGGGDIPEAILPALEYAFDAMRWRPAAQRVVLIIADAPPHDGDVAELRSRVRNASRGQRSPTVVSALFTGGRDLGAEHKSAAEKALKDLAATGGGEYADLSDLTDVGSQLVTIAIGSQHKSAVQRLLQERSTHPRVREVAKRVAAKDANWLLGRLRRPPVEPALVDGLVDLGSQAVVLRCLALVGDEQAAAQSRHAALYVLRRLTGYSGALDPEQPFPAQEADLRSLRDVVAAHQRESGERQPRRVLRGR